MRRITRAGFAPVLVLAAALGSAATAWAQAPLRNWPNSPPRHGVGATAETVTPSFAQNLRGGVVTVGNTLLTCPGNVAAARRRAAEACRSANNNDQDMRFVNVDPSRGHGNSSSAAVTVPAGAHVLRAYLYWGADLGPGVNNPPSTAASGGADPERNDLWRTAKLRVGASAGYTTVDAQAADRDGKWRGVNSWYSTPGNRPGFAYQVRADVTRELSDGIATTQRRTRGGDPQVTVTVADVQAGHGYNRHGGWTLVVVWEGRTAPWRNVTLFDGFAFVQVQSGQQLVVGPLDFTGFQTPASGAVDAHATSWTYEGDREITKDYLALGGTTDVCADLPHAQDAANPVDNFFNSTISRGGATVAERVPAFVNQLGFDLDALEVLEGTIPNGATGASVCLGTTGDTYFFGGIAFDTLIRAPNLQIAKDADRAQASPGDLVTYTTTVSNPATRPPDDPLAGTPTAAAINLTVADPLPSGLDFVDFAVNPGGTCVYDAALRSVRCAVGRLDPDATFSFQVRARVSAAAQGDAAATLRNAACYRANSEDQPTVNYLGCDEAPVEVPPAPYTDLGVVKTVSDDVVAPGATLTWRIVATNHGPGSSTNFVLADELPPGVGFVSHAVEPALTCATPPVGAGGSVVCTAASGPGRGSSVTLTIVGTVSAAAVNGALLRNVATVSGNENEPVPDEHPNRDEALTRVVVPDQPLPPPPAPDPDPAGADDPPVPPAGGGVSPSRVADTRLALRKRATRASVGQGGLVTFRLRVRNAGEAAALGVRVCDLLPRGMTVEFAPGLRGFGRAMCARVPVLRVGASRSFLVTARVAAAAGRTLTNPVTARAANAPRVRARATVRVVPRPRFTG